MPAKVEISHRTIIFTVFFLLLLGLLIQVREIIFWVFVSFILMSALKPVVDELEKLHIPRVLAVLVMYVCTIALFLIVSSTLIPPLITQSVNLVQSLPIYGKNLLPFFTLDSQVISQQLAPLGQNIVKVTIGVFSNIIAIFTIIIISFYLLLERENIKPQLSEFMGEEGSNKLMSILSKVEDKLGAWVRGQLTLMIIIGLATFIGLSLLQIPFALPLAILAGALEIVPIIGPVLAGIPAILVAVTISPFFALATFALYFFVQQIENSLIVPMVMRSAVGLPPVITIIALMIGAKLTGVAGALLSIPILVAVQTVVVEYWNLKEPREEKGTSTGSS